MTIEELKAKVESHRETLKKKDGSFCRFNEAGPVGMPVIDAIVATLEAQQRQIDELKRQP